MFLDKIQIRYSIISLVFIVMLTSCEFRQSVNKDLVTGANSRGNGLSCEEVLIEIDKTVEEVRMGDEVECEELRTCDPDTTLVAGTYHIDCVSPDNPPCTVGDPGTLIVKTQESLVTQEYISYDSPITYGRYSIDRGKTWQYDWEMQ